MNNEYLILLVHGIAYLAEAFILFWIGRAFYNLFHPKVDVENELVHVDNLAFSVSYVGYCIGVLLAIGSAIIGPSQGLWVDLMDIGIFGLLAIFLLNLSGITNDKLVLSKFNLHKEIIEDQNLGTGVIESANYIGSGLIILGAITGHSMDISGGILSAIVFWAVGQLLMVVVAKVYNAMTPYDVHEHIAKKNVAVGIGFAGAMLAIANLIRFGLSGDLHSWTESFTEVGFEVVIGLIFLPIARVLSDKILLPGRKLTDEIVNQEHPNSGAALIEAFAYVGGSVLITWVI